MPIPAERMEALQQARQLEAQITSAQEQLILFFLEYKPLIEMGAFNPLSIQNYLLDATDIIRNTLSELSLGDEERGERVNDISTKLEKSSEIEDDNERVTLFQNAVLDLLWFENSTLRQKISAEMDEIFATEITAIFEKLRPLSSEEGTKTFTLNSYELKKLVQGKLVDLYGSVINSDQVDPFLNHLFNGRKEITVSVISHENSRTLHFEFPDTESKPLEFSTVLAHKDKAAQANGAEVAYWASTDKWPRVDSDIEIMMVLWAVASSVEEMRVGLAA